MIESIGKLILRLGMGGLMITHGWGKLTHLISTGEFQFADPIGIGVEASLIAVIFAEFFCSVFILVGFKTRLSAILPAFAMAVAALIFHADDPFGKQELPLLYFVGYLSLIFLGGGEYAVDQWMFRRKYK